MWALCSITSFTPSATRFTVRPLLFDLNIVTCVARLASLPCVAHPARRSSRVAHPRGAHRSRIALCTAPFADVQRNWESSWILLLLLSLTTASGMLVVLITVQVVREEFPSCCSHVRCFWCFAPVHSRGARTGGGGGTGAGNGAIGKGGSERGTSYSALPPAFGKLSSFAKKESVDALSRQPRVELNTLALQPRDNLEAHILHTPRASAREQQEKLTNESKLANDKLKAAMAEEQYRQRYKLAALELEVAKQIGEAANSPLLAFGLSAAQVLHDSLWHADCPPLACIPIPPPPLHASAAPLALAC